MEKKNGFSFANFSRWNREPWFPAVKRLLTDDSVWKLELLCKHSQGADLERNWYAALWHFCEITALVNQYEQAKDCVLLALKPRVGKKLWQQLTHLSSEHDVQQAFERFVMPKSTTWRDLTRCLNLNPDAL